MSEGKGDGYARDGAPSSMTPSASSAPSASQKAEYHAHTAGGRDGKPDPNQANWQLLKDHLRNVAALARRFAEPPDLVPSLLAGVKLLTRDYGVTAVFMTATQPAFSGAGDAVIGGWNPTPISADENGLADALRRTRIELPTPEQRLAWEDVANRLAAESQALCVVNTTADARHLFTLLRQRTAGGFFHLPSRLCPQNRREKLEAIRHRLRDGLPCRLVSTQLIEAGVDVDFSAAYMFQRRAEKGQCFA